MTLRLGEWQESIRHEADIECAVCGAFHATKYVSGVWGYQINEETGEKHWFHWCGNQWHPCRERVP